MEGGVGGWLSEQGGDKTHKSRSGLFVRCLGRAWGQWPWVLCRSELTVVEVTGGWGRNQAEEVLGVGSGLRMDGRETSLLVRDSNKD